ncbi:RTA1-domain-containing protein [Lentithecium fluviatile CBS 122367]|uniref:RTA1-domain-containing protein n=1 Tax=Lentithecium fluviatile CBS 122367 TaxID=1168545 RepID=A0A6G1IFY7_9PLEO|nr:RTA1-domain-containing protein [Lentithecium fluviatile CBS 122367]
MAKRPRPDINDPTRFVYYRYGPSLEAAIVFVILFSLTTAFHIFQIGKKRTWYFIPLAIGGIFESVGYIGRILSHYDQWKLSNFIMQYLLLLVAPALFAASIYIILGRIILLVDGERYAPIRQRWLTKIFVTGDVISFLVQGGGGGIMGSGTEKGMKIGEKLVLVGLFLQLFFFAIFVIVAGTFHYRLVRARPLKKYAGAAPTSFDVHALPWKRHLVALYLASTLILVRSTFRVVEYLMGNAGFLLRKEIFLYIFDAVLMLAVMLIFNWVHPSQVTEALRERLEAEKNGNASKSEMQVQVPQEEVRGGPWS